MNMEDDQRNMLNWKYWVTYIHQLRFAPGPNASVCNPENTVSQYGSTEAVTTYTDIYEEQDANVEAYLERSIPAQAVECLKSMKLGHQERDFVGFGHQRLNHYYQTLPMHKHSEKHP